MTKPENGPRRTEFEEAMDEYFGNEGMTTDQNLTILNIKITKLEGRVEELVRMMEGRECQ